MTKQPPRWKKYWTPEEDAYLREHWGGVSRPGMAKHLGRTAKAVKMRAIHLGLGAPNKAQDLLIVGNVVEAMGYSRHCGNTIFDGAPTFYKVTADRRRFLMIRQEDLFEWLRTHQERYTLAGMQDGALGPEPDWMREKRRSDIRIRMEGGKRWRDKWTPAELDEAVRLHRKGWTDEQIGQLHGRTPKAVYAALMRAGEWRS